MAKAFIVRFKSENSYNSMISVNWGTASYPAQTVDTRPIIVIANTINETAFKYPTAIEIVEFDAKEVIILDKVICPVK